MKTKIATALSLVGVLGAGSAAALVNTQILDGGSTSDSAASVLAPANPVTTVATTATSTTTTPTTVSATVASTVASTTSPATTIPVTVATTPQPAAPSGLLTSYNVGTAGVVTVDVLAGDVVLVSVTPASGWTVTKSEQDSDAPRVEVKFTSGTTLVEFEVSLVNGQLVPRVESKSIASANTVPSNTTSNTIDDGDDDDHDADHSDDDDDHSDDDDDHDDDGGNDDHGDDGGNDDHGDDDGNDDHGDDD